MLAFSTLSGHVKEIAAENESLRRRVQEVEARALAEWGARMLAEFELHCSRSGVAERGQQNRGG